MLSSAKKAWQNCYDAEELLRRKTNGGAQLDVSDVVGFSAGCRVDVVPLNLHPQLFQ